MAEMPFATGTPDTWDEGTQRFALRRDGTELYGPCPRCGHELSKSLSTMSAPGFGGGAPGRTVKLRVKCNCGQSHPGPGADGLGCGAVGGVELES